MALSKPTRVERTLITGVGLFASNAARTKLGGKARRLGASLNVPSTPSLDVGTQGLILDASITDTPCKLARVIQRWSTRRKQARGRHVRTRNGSIICTVRSDTGITFRDVIASLHQRGKGDAWSKVDLQHTLSNDWTIEDLDLHYEESFYEQVRVGDEVEIELPTSVVPNEEEWQEVQ
ncbi:hypothetical protein BST61_g11529 [Cercospora zeina]